MESAHEVKTFRNNKATFKTAPVPYHMHKISMFAGPTANINRSFKIILYPIYISSDKTAEQQAGAIETKSTLSPLHNKVKL